MMTKDVIYLLFFLLGAVLLSCKDDSVNNSTPTPPVTTDSLLFTYDSIYSGPLGHYNTEADYYIKNQSIKRIKGTFELNTNDTSSNICLASFTIIADSTYAEHIYGKAAHGKHAYILPVYFAFPDSAFVRFTVSSPVSGNLFISMRNIKLYKTN